MGGGGAERRRWRSAHSARALSAAAARTCGARHSPYCSLPVPSALSPTRTRARAAGRKVPRAAARRSTATPPQPHLRAGGGVPRPPKLRQARGRPRPPAIKWLVKEMQVSGRSGRGLRKARRGARLPARPGPALSVPPHRCSRRRWARIWGRCRAPGGSRSAAPRPARTLLLLPPHPSSLPLSSLFPLFLSLALSLFAGLIGESCRYLPYPPFASPPSKF